MGIIYIPQNKVIMKYNIVPLSDFPPSMQAVSRKWIDWDDDKVDLIQSLILNGYDDHDVAKQLGCTLKTYKYRVNQQPDIKRVFQNAKETAVANSTKALQKIAEGYYEYELTYGNEFKMREQMMDLVNSVLDYIPEGEREEFEKKIDILLEEGEIVKKVRKWYPPNKDAINKILDAHKGDIWDAEARRKSIPQVKLNVTVDEKQLRARKALKPDYEVIDS